MFIDELRLRITDAWARPDSRGELDFRGLPGCCGRDPGLTGDGVTARKFDRGDESLRGWTTQKYWYMCRTFLGETLQCSIGSSDGAGVSD